MIYLDNSATTRQYDRVTERMIHSMKEDFGNPSSLYGMGVDAEKAIKESRRALFRAMGKRESEGSLYFTSGGTEADNTAVFGAAQAKKGEAARSSLRRWNTRLYWRPAAG